MDKQSVIGFVLIGVVLTFWMMYTSTNKQPSPQPQHIDQLIYKDSSTIQPQKKTDTTAAPITLKKEEKKNISSETKYGKYFAGKNIGIDKTITIETKNYTAIVSSKGGLIQKWIMKKYLSWDKHPVQLISDSTGGDFSLLFTTTDGKLINTKNLYFDFPENTPAVITLNENDTYTLNCVLHSSEGTITKKLTFKNTLYEFDAELEFHNMQNVIANYEYQVTWENGIRYQEASSVDESNSAEAFLYAGGEKTEINATSKDEIPVSNTSGTTDWVALRNKYFAVAMVSKDKKSTGAYMEGRHYSVADNGAVEIYSIAMKMPFKGGENETTALSVFIGPLDFKVIKSFNESLEGIMSLGWSWIRPLTVYIFIPLFNLFHSFIPNYGIVILVFSVIIKLALQPLTKSSMRSMRKMQKLKPMMDELRAKYKNDAQTMNVKTMELYKDYGVNPAGGCLPLLLQMPILYSLYSLFTASIQLRQEPFVLWINDLSVPDVLISLPFVAPLIGNHISGLTLAMGVTMFFQQRQTVTDPTQKAMIWMMPIMMTIMFNHFPAGLNLYYFTFNILSIGQQWYFNKRHEDEPLKKVERKNKKPSMMERLAQNMPKPPKK